MTATLPGRGTGCAAGVCVFRADAPSFEKTEEATLSADLCVQVHKFFKSTQRYRKYHDNESSFH